MFKRIGIRWIALIALAICMSFAQGAVYHHNYPKGYYYRSGHWYRYRGYGHPYRGGYYDRWGRWHRY